MSPLWRVRLSFGRTAARHVRNYSLNHTVSPHIPNTSDQAIARHVQNTSLFGSWNCKSDLQQSSPASRIIDGILAYKTRFPDMHEHDFIPDVYTYLNILGSFNPSMSAQELSKICDRITTFVWLDANVFDLGKGLYLVFCNLKENSLNAQPLAPGTKILTWRLRTFAITYSKGAQTSSILEFDAFILGRLTQGDTPTYWVVAVDEYEQLWAFRADSIGEGLRNDSEEPFHWRNRWRTSEFKEQKNLFSCQSPVTRLCTLGELHARLGSSGKPISPSPVQLAEKWVSHRTLANNKFADKFCSLVPKPGEEEVEKDHENWWENCEMEWNISEYDWNMVDDYDDEDYGYCGDGSNDCDRISVDPKG